MTSMYEHAGGDAALHRLEDLFYSKVLADLLLQPLFGEGQPHHVEHLTWFTAESFGGPDRFTRELGFDHLVKVHRGHGITDEQRERFVALYLEALDEAGLPADEPFREAVRLAHRVRRRRGPAELTSHHRRRAPPARPCSALGVGWGWLHGRLELTSRP
jgi:hemoglobin